MRLFISFCFCVTLLAVTAPVQAQSSADKADPAIIVNFDVLGIPAPETKPPEAPKVEAPPVEAPIAPVVAEPVFQVVPQPTSMPEPVAVPVGSTVTLPREYLAPSSSGAESAPVPPQDQRSQPDLEETIPAELNGMLFQPIEKAPDKKPAAHKTKPALPPAGDLSGVKIIESDPAVTAPKAKPAAPPTPLDPDAPAQNPARVIPKQVSQGELHNNTFKFDAYRLVFDGASITLAPSEQALLDDAVTRMQAEKDLRLQMHSYAGGTPEEEAKARRLSLARAMKIRQYLLGKNIAATRMEVRALGRGNSAMGDAVGQSKAPPDRIEITFIQ
ncbi:MAG: hypothetical protein JWM96_1082 [Alphaproteobacteria bacterium]|nr:hypothetical protein [Alphaproteobacteria bacterium]